MASSIPTRRCCSERAGLTCGFALLLKTSGRRQKPSCAWRPTGTATTTEKSVTAIDLWEESFFQSEFTHASGVRKHIRFRGGFLAMWQSLAGQEAFPEKYLVKLPQKLAEFVRNDDHSYRNDNRNED